MTERSMEKEPTSGVTAIPIMETSWTTNERGWVCIHGGPVEPTKANGVESG